MRNYMHFKKKLGQKTKKAKKKFSQLASVLITTVPPVQSSQPVAFARSELPSVPCNLMEITSTTYIKYSLRLIMCSCAPMFSAIYPPVYAGLVAIN